MQNEKMNEINFALWGVITIDVTELFAMVSRKLFQLKIIH